VVYVKAYVAMASNENLTITYSGENNSRKRKIETKDYPLRSKYSNETSKKYESKEYTANKASALKKTRKNIMNKTKK